jgi:hypothetical protein
MPRVLVGLGALAMVAAGLPGALRAELVWLRAAAVEAGARGLSAVATDPEDARVVWVAGGGRVFVSDDAGETWQIVLDLGRSVDREVEAEENEDGEEIDEEEGEASEIDPDDAEEEAEDTRSREATEAEEASEEARVGGERAESAEEIEQTIGSRIVRLRVIGDRVWVSWGRGLWWVPRAARGLGGGQEHRFGRSAAVLDVAAAGEVGLWIATSRGLLVGDRDGLATPVTGPLGSQPAQALLPHPTGLVVASSDGLWVGGAAGFTPLGLTLGRAAVEDLAGWAPSDVLVAGGFEATRVTLAVGGAPARVVESWRVPLTRRVAVGRGAWAVGPEGAWKLGPEGWRRASDGISDTRLLDLAQVRREGDDDRFWVVGRGGAWRLVPELERVRVMRERRQNERGLEGAEEVLLWTELSRGVALEQAGDLRSEEAAAPLLPNVELHYIRRLWRDETRVLSELQGDYLVDEVSVAPRNGEIRVILRWDLTPALWPTGTRSAAVEAEELRLARGREAVRRTVLPAFAAWRIARSEARDGAYPNPLAALSAEIERQRLEADLFVYTNGRFNPESIPGGMK